MSHYRYLGLGLFHENDKKIIGEKLIKAKEFFIESDFVLTKEELLEKLK